LTEEQAAERSQALQPWEQIDLPAKVKSVRRKTRPWKSIIALLFAIVTAVGSAQLKADGHPGRGESRGGFFNNSGLSQTAATLLWIVATFIFLICGSIATYSLASKTRELLEPKTGASHAAVTRYAILIIGAFTTLVVTLQLFGIPIGQLVLGGALTSVFVGIAAQQALSNVFAGLVLLFARPFRVGDEIRLRAGALGGQIEGVVTDISITYVRLSSGGSVVSVPNSQVLNAVVGPVPPRAEEDSTSAEASDGETFTQSAATTREGAAREGAAVNPGGPDRQGLRPPGPA
jgi:Mechanosensitive ion channel